MKKYTEGPWEANYDKRRDNYSIMAAGPAGLRPLIAFTKCESVPAQHEANAALIAAAPDLLEALKHAVNWHDQLTPKDIARYKAAIAKAEGKKQ